MNIAYRGTGAQAGWTSEESYIDGDRTTEAALQLQLETKPEGFLLVTRSEAHAPIQGCVWLEPLDSDTWYLGSLTIDPTLQNSGLGRELLKSAERWAVERGATTMQMTVVNIRETLIAWYERRGYRLTGEIRPFPYGDNRFGVPRREGLAFVVLEKLLTSV
jgi:ribosomal protein S18 acetylase RimI-like enzyme